jgi:thymidylate synthase
VESRIIHVTTHSIGDAWFQVVKSALQFGVDYRINRGSFVDHVRRELESLALYVAVPWARPFSPFVPAEVPTVADDESIQIYFETYWISPDKAENEDYTYGERIHPQLFPLIEMLKATPDTNQACIAVARPEDIFLSDPPCLRLIDYKLRNGVLSPHAYFRSWDIWAALPFNLGALQLLTEFIADEVGCKTGPLYVYSKGAHLYDYQWKPAIGYIGHLIGIDPEDVMSVDSMDSPEPTGEREGD